jgi:hypothetical protein
MVSRITALSSPELREVDVRVREASATSAKPLI